MPSVQQFFAGTCVYYVYKGSYHQVSNSKYITIYLALPFSYVTLHFVVPEKLGFLVSMLFDAKLTLTILASSLYLHRHTRAVAFCCTSTLIAHNIHAFKYILMV